MKHPRPTPRAGRGAGGADRLGRCPGREGAARARGRAAPSRLGDPRNRQRPPSEGRHQPVHHAAISLERQARCDHCQDVGEKHRGAHAWGIGRPGAG
ncbi:unnamed protein product [Prorocentrum cordatum]|uniref:Uncharacterized protein n=1 Tax=Prorocentrum cordatum TaxID=2364126 RepID=A0ABN9PMK9_9DINO|nr:unnamed protein product [Polarella glacialis]